MDVTWEARFRALVGERDDQVKWERATALSVGLEQEEIAHLVGALRSEVEEERQAATRVLLRATSGQGDVSRIGESRELAETLERVVSTAYPKSIDSRQALKILAKVDAAGTAALMRSMDVQVCSDEELRTIVLDATQYDRAGTWGILERIADRGGTAGRLARERIEVRDGLTKEALRKLADEWRTSRSNEALSRLYSVFVKRQPTGTPLSSLCDLLGETSGRDGRGAWWNAQGRSVYVTLDENEGMVTHDLSE